MKSYTELDRPARRDDEEIEVTPEMIEAGVEFLRETGQMVEPDAMR